MEWLGEVPEHWEVKRLEHVAFYRTSSIDKKTEEDELPVRLCNYTDVYYGDRIRVSEGEFMNATASTSEVQRFRLLVGDILVTKDSEDWRDIAVPAIVDETAERLCMWLPPWSHTVRPKYTSVVSVPCLTVTGSQSATPGIGVGCDTLWTAECGGRTM